MRPVRVATIAPVRRELAEDNAATLRRAVELIEKVGRDRPDIILLPETFACRSNDHSPSATRALAQSVPGPLSEELAPLARRFQTHIAFGMLRADGERTYNSLVMLDRDGRCVWSYDKVTPVDWEMATAGISPGGTPQPYRCELGCIAGAICFDINYWELAELYSREGVELVLFASAFPAGRLLDGWAVRYGFAIAGSTYYASNRILDCTGATVGRTSDLLPYATAVLNVNRRVVHMDYNLAKLDRMRSQYAGDVLIEDLREEALCVVTSLKPGLEVAELMREFAVTPLWEYFDHSRRVREEHGGWRVA